MQDAVSAYLGSVQKELATGHAQEHSYRPALKALFEAVTTLAVVNEPKGSAYGRPDLILVRGDIPIAWAEAKDLHVSLDKVEKSEQMERYFGYANLILTNGLEFRFFKNGKRYGEAAILAIKDGSGIVPKPEAHEPFVRQLTGFIEEPADTIRSAEHLAKIMGGKAARLRDNIVEILKGAGEAAQGREIAKIRDVLKAKLIHDLTDEAFADLYAQTLVYGLFVARYHDDTPETFSRTEARDRIPASNHLLQQFFDHIAGANFERRLSFIVDELCDVFLHADVRGLVHGLFRGKEETHDPIIHFYEDFLREYDPELRTARGVFYTPLPVVRYIVRSVDALLQEHFGLEGGLADRATMEWHRTIQGKKAKQTIDRVQILDPAVGTGTFLNEVIRTIHERFKGQEGTWPAYVNDHLLGRLNGFELMMASYTIAHLKLGMTLAETGATSLRRRLRVFLTNSLEEAPRQDDSLFRFLGFQEAISEEAEAAAEVKRELPIMVVLGNPPYSVSSQNASVEAGPDGKRRKTWIGALLDDYKKDLKEKKLNLDDDYIKFICFAHHLIEKNGQGVVAMITNNSFLDGITHRRMRQSLMETFDRIYVLDLHGSSKRREKTPDGGKDENVFDITQGVSINLLVKTGPGKRLGVVRHIDVYGTRKGKETWLDAHDVSSTEWRTLNAGAPHFFFVPKDFSAQEEYERGFRIDELSAVSNSGVQTDRDALFIDIDKDVLVERMQLLFSGNYDQQFVQQFDVRDSSSYKLTEKTRGKRFEERFLQHIQYRPFDERWIYYDPEVISRPAYAAARHLLQPNIALIAKRGFEEQSAAPCFVTRVIMDRRGWSRPGMQGAEHLFPLYLYAEDGTRTPNLRTDIIVAIEHSVGATEPEDIFDYAYAILHSLAYRTRYREFLKIDFPRLPFPRNHAQFWAMVGIGRELRELHLLESPSLRQMRTTFPVAGTNLVEKVRFESGEVGKVWINATQYFGNVPRTAWEFFVGGYQPTQKWLKDRKGRSLSSDDLHHYQQIIVVLIETYRLMKEVDAVIDASGGWPMK